MISHDVFSTVSRNETVATATLRIDMIADLVCPWCYLGKRRLAAALASVHGPSVVSWSPFQLNPDMPAGGMGIEEYLSSRFGNVQAVQPALDELTRVGEQEGIRFRFDRLARVPNTVDAHRLVMYAEAHGVPALDIVEGSLRAFFEDGQDLSDRDVLIEVGTRQGLERQALVEMLGDDRLRKMVLTREAQVRRSGVTGVPNFLVNNRLFVVGAHPATALVEVFDRAMFGEESDQPLNGTLN